MPSYQYEALRMSDRSKITGLISAGTEREARELLREQDLIPTKLKSVAKSGSKNDGAKKSDPLSNFLGQFQGIGMKEKVAFSQNLGMMMKSGIPVTEALMYFENYCKNVKFQKIISRIRKDILAGYSFSQALGKHKKIFNEVFVSVIQAGETSGELEAAMERMTELQIKEEKLKKKVIGASIYPCIVIGIVGLVLLVMFMWVLPTFAEIYEKMGAELPMITQVMLGISAALTDYWYITFGLVGISLFGLLKYLTSAGGKIFLDAFILRIPVMGPLFQDVNSSHFISTFAVSFGAGLPITEALQLAAHTVQHTQMRRIFMQVNVQIQAGERLAVALAKTELLPDLVLLMLSTGEESGELDKMLENSFDFLEQEINHKIDVMVSMMEPMLLMVIGGIVGLVAFALVTPMFSIYENF